jgi:hypothetical protein
MLECELEIGRTVRLGREMFRVLLLLCGHFAMDYSKALFNFFGLPSYYDVIVFVC